MNCKACKSPCVGTYRQNLNAGNSAWCIEYLKESRVKDIKNYRYHKDSRLPEALKYRKEAELSQEERELDEVASDIIEAMESDLDSVLDNSKG